MKSLVTSLMRNFIVPLLSQRLVLTIQKELFLTVSFSLVGYCTKYSFKCFCNLSDLTISQAISLTTNRLFKNRYNNITRLIQVKSILKQTFYNLFTNFNQIRLEHLSHVHLGDEVSVFCEFLFYFFVMYRRICTVQITHIRHGNLM